jgi:hypothetical protein
MGTMFGIELRKKGNVTELYKDVDKVLSNMEPYEMETQTVIHALNKMLKPDRHFNVCCVKECANMVGIVISKEHWNLYNAVHCMDWSEMTEDYRQKLVAILLDDFRRVIDSKWIS